MTHFRIFVCVLAALGLMAGSGRGSALPPTPYEQPALAPSSQQPGGPVTAEQAISTAVNQLGASAGGWRLRHPQHTVDFAAAGVQFMPRRGGPAWGWSLTWVGAGDLPLTGVDMGAVAPELGGPEAAGSETVTYHRGGLDERYVARAETIEQQFVIAAPLDLAGAELVIVGRVNSPGAFEATADGWQWQTEAGAVRLGQVHVSDANGRKLPASLTVSAGETRLVVEGDALARAAYPVLIDPEIGANDFRLSDMGGDTLFDAEVPALAYNSTDKEYLVVWQGDDNTYPYVEGEFEIYGQRVDAATGAKIGAELRLSDMGPDGNLGYDAEVPAVAYNSTNNQYLVVWEGDDSPDGETEIFGQRVEGQSGAEIGGDLRLSDMGTDGNIDIDAYYPAVAYNPTGNEYLVVWQGDDDTTPTVDDEFEIYGQRLNAATGAETGTNDFRLSDMGPNGSPAYAAEAPAVAYNSTNNQYLVAWQGDDNSVTQTDGDTEIFIQRVDAATGDELGTDTRLSTLGPDFDPYHDAYEPAVAYNSTNNEYLVVWWGEDDTGTSLSDENEIFGQRVNAATGAEVGADDFRISDLGPEVNASYRASKPAIAYNPTNNQYLVVWQGDDNTGQLVDDETEIFGQRLNAATGAEIGTNDFRLSDMGPNGEANFDALEAALAYNPTNNQYFGVWSGDDNTSEMVNDEFEIFGQRMNGATGAEIGANDFRISQMGEDRFFRADVPAAAYNSINNQYLVVWSGDDNTGTQVNNENEIFGQRVDAATGAEIGDDFRLSDAGPDGDIRYTVSLPAVAYNSANNQYLVVWHGNDDLGTLALYEYEIFGQRVDAATGAEVGVDTRLSDMGPDGDTLFYGAYPAVTYNSTDNQYLVVWQGDDNTGPLVDDETEIFAQRLNGATGAEIGPNDFRLSDMGPNGNTHYAAAEPSAAYNSANNQYLVVWSGDDAFPLNDDEMEIFGQRVEAATGAEIGGDIRLSDMGPDGNTLYDAAAPAVAYNSANNQYLVVWHGDDNTGTLVEDELEIFAQRLNGATGAEVGVDTRLSDMGPDGSPLYYGAYPAITYNSTDNQYLVVWQGDDHTGPLVDNEFEIWGQLVSGATGLEIGTNDFRVSDMGPDGNILYYGQNPAAAYNSVDDEYLVVWQGIDNTPPLTVTDFEIFGQRFEIDAPPPPPPPSYLLFLPFVMR